MPKEGIKKEYGRSPDRADALAMSFFDLCPILPQRKDQRYDDYAW